MPLWTQFFLKGSQLSKWLPLRFEICWFNHFILCNVCISLLKFWIIWFQLTLLLICCSCCLKDLIELDDEHDAVDVSVQSAVNMVKTGSKIAETEASISGMSVPEQPLLSSSKSIPFTKIEKPYDASHDSEKERSFRFPVATNSGGLSLPSLPPTIPSQSHDKLLSRNEQTVVPVFMFGSMKSGTDIPSSVTDVTNESLVASKPEKRSATLWIFFSFFFCKKTYYHSLSLFFFLSSA